MGDNNGLLILIAAIVVPIVTIGALGFVLIMSNRSTTVFERDANGNIIAVISR